MSTLNKTPNKRKKKEEDKKRRIYIPFNTGTRTHKTKKDYNRQKKKKEVYKIFSEQ